KRPSHACTIRRPPSTPASCGRILAWTVEYDPRVEKDLRKLDRAIQRDILDYLEQRIATADNPRRFGKPLRHSQYGLWRYRVRDYRIVCRIQEATLTVLVLAIGHRSTVYD